MASQTAAIDLPAGAIRQHLIDPALCIRCDTCESACTTGAITNDSVNYVVNAEICNGCLDCLPGCPTGAIDNWLPVARAYSVAEQYGWTELPPPLELGLAAAVPSPAGRGAPASAALARENIFTREHPLLAEVVESLRLTVAESPSEIRHVVLDAGADFPFLEGQSVGIIPPGADAQGRPHIMRLYSVASPRTGEAGVAGRIALTVKRVLEDHEGAPHVGVCSNFVCGLRAGGKVEVVGPYGASFLMPDDPAANLLMIATGTGIAPMRAMLERRLGRAGPGRQALFYGGRTPGELPYHAELAALAQGFLDLNLAFSRVPGQRKQYVQQLLGLRHELVAQMLVDGNSYIYLCGLKGMEAGVLEAFAAICAQHGLPWDKIGAELKAAGRLHIETY
ncbi:hypothetical protein GCM10010909_01170 [Acidocella aquatica]|uniref:Benzoyl-CoA oxygenase component A n=1 Tax=Acidocella aquatica TaxID=1922313 RepID=A0ABQ5ZZ00_9PROT|nr:4Fe-4S binding protein [Acidocella aquatica]GLR65439.1 hypothetical protein GCM10010909_01170 [Acidocella aquatica]